MDDPTSQLRGRARAGDADAFGAVFATGIAQPTIAQMLASGHLPASLRAHLATMTKAQRAQYIAVAEQAQKDPIATPRRGTLMQEIVYARSTEVSAPGDR